MDEKSCIIEFQAFRSNKNRFIIKELVILDLLTCVAYPFTFMPPFSFRKLNSKARKTNKWISKNFHHIDWYDGFITYSNLHSIMYHFCKEFGKIYTRGSEKKTWIQQYTHCDVLDVTIDKTFPFQHQNVCFSSRNPKHAQSQCALQNAYHLAAFLEYDKNVVGVPEGIKAEEQDWSTITSIQDSEEATPRTDMASQQFLQTLVEQFNAHSKSNILTVKKCSDLKENKHYIIHEMKKVETTHGDAIIASLSEAPYTSGDEAKFQIYLPKRFVQLLQNEDLRDIEPGSLYLVSHGTSGNNSTELSLHITQK